MRGNETVRRREPITDTQLLMTITICIFVGMYVLAMVSTLLVLICFEAFNFFLHKIRGKKENEE